MTEFDYYIQQGEPSQREKAEAWAIAIGLQDVDGLKPSQYLLETARRHIEGEIDYEETKRLVYSYYETLPANEQDSDEEEADKVALHITQVLSEKTFNFSPAELANIHRRLFMGVLPHAGKYRDVNITKKEWVLNGDTVLYASCDSISATLDYDFGQEKQFSYKGLNKVTIIAHFSKFISGIWQIHPFREGNTRTTAVFAIKYLRKLGYRVTYEPFADNAKYFRNALVRANYQNYEKGIEETTEFLELFFRNVLLGEQHPLKKRYLHIDWKQVASSLGTEKSSEKQQIGTEKSSEKILRIMAEQPTITTAILAKEIGISTRAVDKQIAKLKALGQLQRVGADKGGHWEVIK
mgnify:FL=1